MSTTTRLALLALLSLIVLTPAANAGIFGRRGRVQYYAPAPAAAPAASAPAAAPSTQASAGGYRSYSYQPQAQAAPMMGSYRSSPRPFYSYPKTDPRRYQHN